MYGIEKEMIEDYGVESSVWIGGKRIVLGINEENTEKPRYMSCRIFEQLYHLSEGKSSVTISHRLSNTTLADKILVIDDGHIIEQGSHFELLAQNGKYAQLFNLQASKYI